MRQSPQWQWRLDEVFVKIRGKTHYLWRAVDHEGEVLESYVTKKRDKAAALKFLKNAMKRYGNPHVVVTDRCPSYRAAMKVIGNEGRQGPQDLRHLNNRAEHSHLPFRRRKRAMPRFRRMRSLQKLASIHSSVHNHFNFERHINSRNRFKQKRAAALREGRDLLVA
jgi:putative transposase